MIWRSDHQRVRRVLQAADQQLTEGIEIRCRGRLDFYPPGGRLQLVVREVDPLFTLGLLERRRRQTLAALGAAGLMERNRGLELPPLLLRIGLVTSAGSAAYHDFLSGLQASGYGFRVHFVHAAVQGQAAEGELVSALSAAATAAVDCVVLIRGGGSRSDLALFDSRRVAEAVARCPLPVITGLGHEIDQSIADLVSHTALKTPTQAAEFLIERLALAEQAVRDFSHMLARLAEDRLGRARQALTRGERVAHSASLYLQAVARRVIEAGRSLGRLSRRRLRDAETRLARHQGRLLGAVPRSLERRRVLPSRLARRLAELAASRLREAEAVIEGHRRLCRELAPHRLLGRGFSVTRSVSGVILRSSSEAQPGDIIHTELASGRLDSRVEGSVPSAAQAAPVADQPKPEIP